MIELACAAEGGYVPHSAAMIASVLDHSGGEPVRVHYMHSPRLEAGDAQRLGAMVEALGGSIVFHSIPDHQVADLPDDPLFTRAMWHRILLPELIPAADRVLYLDVDTIAMDDLRPLWSTDLAGRPVAAVSNVFQHNHRGRPALIGLPAHIAYFNSGVLLMNLDWMRRHATADALRRVATERGSALKWPDQDALNLVFGRQRVALHPRWNCMNALFALKDSRKVFGRRAWRAAMRAPGIRHFEGPGANKPWHPGCRRPHRSEYVAYRRATPWPEVLPDS